MPESLLWKIAQPDGKDIQVSDYNDLDLKGCTGHYGHLRRIVHLAQSRRLMIRWAFLGNVNSWADIFFFSVVGRIYPGREEGGVSKTGRRIYKITEVRESLMTYFWRPEYGVPCKWTIGCVCGNGRSWGLKADRHREEMASYGMTGCSEVLLKALG